MLGLGIWCSAQHTINIQSDRCNHCSMSIKDPNFAALAINGDEAYTFDAIECLVNFLKENDDIVFSRLLVADYIHGGRLIEAEKAFFLKSREIPSPMGAYISAYPSEKAAKEVQMEKGGEIYNWEALKKLFEDSRFGLINQPTHHHHLPGAYAPIGIMGDHLHHEGGLMLSFRMMDMRMEDNLKGSGEVTNQSIFQDYMVAPQAMTMRMYMLGAMYAPHDRITLMIMQHFVQKSMDLESMMGMDFSTESAGLGDMRISVLYGLLANDQVSFHLNAALNIPIGDVTQRDHTPMMQDMKLPYAMQLGSGTYDVTLGGTIKGSMDRWSAGIQPLGVIRTGENNQGYRFGNQLDIASWLSYDINRFLSVSGRGLYTRMSGLHGIDDELNPMMAPPANPGNTGHTRIWTYLGSNLSLGDQPVLRDFKIGIEYGIPVYQRVQGIQMSAGSTLLAGLRYSI